MISARCGQADMKFQLAQVMLKVSPFLQLTFRSSFGNSILGSPLPQGPPAHVSFWNSSLFRLLISIPAFQWQSQQASPHGFQSLQLGCVRNTVRPLSIASSPSAEFQVSPWVDRQDISLNMWTPPSLLSAGRRCAQKPSLWHCLCWARL